MNKTIVVLMGLVVGGIAAIGQAYEIKDNPDRKISFGFNFDHLGDSTDYTFRSLKINDFSKTSQNQFLLDAKIPLNDFFTFGIRGGILKSNTTLFTSEETDANGYDIGFGIRYYIP